MVADVQVLRAVLFLILAAALAGFLFEALDALERRAARRAGTEGSKRQR
jgi:hypothetical protein